MDLFNDDIEEEEGDDEAEAKDPIETLHPRRTQIIEGHAAVETRLLEFYNSGRMPHAIIFSGPKGIGKSTMAYRFARFLLKHGVREEGGLFGPPSELKTLDVAADDPVSIRVASGGHGDLLAIERAFDEAKSKQKDIVDVHEVRKIPNFFHMTSAEGGWQVVIIEDADLMNRNAQNALLKILEEPPANSLLILAAHRMGALIPTIRSRAQVVEFQPLESGALKTLLAKYGHKLSTDHFATLQSFCGGSLGRSLVFLEAGGLEMAGKTLDLLEDFPRYDRLAVHKFADSLPMGEEGDKLFSEILRGVFERLARAKSREQGIEGFGVHKQMLEKMLSRLGTERILKICDALQTHFLKVQIGNLDRRQGVLAAFSLLSEA